MRRSHFNVVPVVRVRIEWGAVVPAIADQAGRERVDKPRREGGVDETGFMRRNTGHVDGERKTMAVANRHDFAPLTASMDQRRSPFFHRAEAGVDEGFGQIELPSIAEVLRQASQKPAEQAGTLSRLKATMTGLVRRIPTRQVVPGRPGAEHPEHAVHHSARVLPRATTAIGRRRGRKIGSRIYHWASVRSILPTYDGPHDFVHPPPHWGL